VIFTVVSSFFYFIFFDGNYGNGNNLTNNNVVDIEGQVINPSDKENKNEKEK